MTWYTSDIGRKVGVTWCTSDIGRKVGVTWYTSDIGRKVGVTWYTSDIGRKEGVTWYTSDPYIAKEWVVGGFRQYLRVIVNCGVHSGLREYLYMQACPPS